jgi:hypothetical protein
MIVSDGKIVLGRSIDRMAPPRKDEAMQFESMSKGALCCCQRCVHVSSDMGKEGSLS